ncbi:MAG: two-component system, OmpR family, response regulator RegX3 [Nocardioidaceae bacterium]|jgi:DNA-binding response OmpR family regulator|nr:two-component system, OmpR family, response regulator RegX3 [Nocardioidaceae bacterium]
MMARGKRRVIAVDGMELDLGAMTLQVDGRQVHLTLQEFRILTVLLESAGRVITRRELLDLAWGHERGRTSNTLSVLVGRLRTKLLRPDGTGRIRTVRSVGYIVDRSSPLARSTHEESSLRSDRHPNEP